MSLPSTINLKPVSESAEEFVLILSKDQTGTVRVSTSEVAPNRSELKINPTSSTKKYTSTSGNQTKVSTINRRSVSLPKTVYDAAGDAHLYTVSVTIVYPENATVTKSLILDSIRQVIDMFASTSPVSLDTTTIDQLLRGEA
jgi:hypothetical protein